jgi:hypothetical protein
VIASYEVIAYQKSTFGTGPYLLIFYLYRLSFKVAPQPRSRALPSCGQGWIYWGGAGGAHPPRPGQGDAGGVLFFMIKQKIFRDKMRFSNLNNKMMISEQLTTITI